MSNLNFFHCKNGMLFRNKLVNANEGDPMTCIMFTDNMSNHKMNFIIIPLVEHGEYQEAIKRAFNWKSSNEGKRIWNEIYQKMGEA